MTPSITARCSPYTSARNFSSARTRCFTPDSTVTHSCLRDHARHGVERERPLLAGEVERDALREVAGGEGVGAAAQLFFAHLRERGVDLAVRLARVGVVGVRRIGEHLVERRARPCVPAGRWRRSPRTGPPCAEPSCGRLRRCYCARVLSRTISSGWKTTWRGSSSGSAASSMQDAHGRLADQLARLPDRRERHDGRRGEVDVVEADEQDVAGHEQGAVHHERLQQAHRDEVVRGEHRVGAVGRVAGDERLADAPPFEHGERAGLEHLELGAGHGIHRLPRTRHAGRRPAGSRTARPRTRGGGARLEQVLGGEPAAGDVVDRHRAERAVAAEAVDQHGGGAA